MNAIMMNCIILLKISFVIPIGAVGGSLIRMNGKAERNWWQVFNNFEERAGMLALKGFTYDGPAQTIGFKPVWKPEDHASFFTTSSAWGLFSQTQNKSGQNCNLQAKYGPVQIQAIELETLDNKKGSKVMVMLDGVQQSIVSSKQNGNTLTVNLKSECRIKSGSELMISFNFEN